MIILSEKITAYPSIVIGRKTEYGYKNLEFDLTEYIDKYGSGTVSAAFTYEGAEESYLLDTEFDSSTNVLTVPISDKETTEAGRHTISIDYYPPDGKCIPFEFTAIVKPIVQASSGNPPEVIRSWMDSATAKLAELATALANLTTTVAAMVAEYWSQHKSEVIAKPSEDPVPGKVLRVKSVNEDGTFICEWANVVVKMTQEEYEKITPDPNTVYVITSNEE